MVNQEVLASQDFFVVGIGASAGGLRALEEFFDHMSADSGAAFVVIQHLSPDFKSLMKELLQRRTSMEVHRVTEGMELNANSVYLIPPGKNLILKEGKLSLEARTRNKEREPNFPIDIFFQSLAHNYGDRSIGVILSGSGSDGTRGLSFINEAGGIALVQEPGTAEFDGMPRSAISTGVVNQILPPRELAQLVYQCAISAVDFVDLNVNQRNLLDTSGIKEITAILKEVEEFDFSHYKASTISRRIHRRRLINNAKSMAEYIDFLRNSAEERKILSSDLLINVTHFFRDSPAWAILENNIIPTLLENTAPNEELRFWVAACSTGEEAYSLAILIDEALSDLQKSVKVKIFATDLDRNALEKASLGLYSEAIVKDISAERLQKYFVMREEQFQVVRKLREMLIFAPQDLTKDAGFTRMHFISCRNVLIYMQPNLQYYVLRSLHFSLLSQGILFLGEAETLGQLEDEFNALNKKWKVYQKRRDVKLPLLVRNPQRLVAHRLNYAPTLERQSRVEPILEQTINWLLEESNAVALLVNGERQLIQVCGDGSKILKTPQGKITNDVTKMVKPGLQLPLNTALYRAKKEKQPVIYTRIQAAELDNTYSLKVIHTGTKSTSNEFYLIKIQEESNQATATTERDICEISTDAGNRILSLEYELQQTRENLQTLIEELETTNEEQQASNEELIASNEELQSTNEELHSVNEELHTVNIEYQTKIQELIELNYDVENLLKSTDIGVIFLDSNLKIRKFTPAIKEVIALRDTDTHRPLQELSSKFELSNFISLLAQVIQTQKPTEVEIKLKKSQQYFLMRVNPYYIEKQQCDGIVVSFIKLDEVKKAQQELQATFAALTQSEARLNLALSVGGIGIWIWNFTEDCLIWDERLLNLHPIDSARQPHTLADWLNLIHPQDRKKVKQKVLNATKNQKYFDVEYRTVKADGTVSYFSTRGKVYLGNQQESSHITGVTINVTEIREAERKLLALNQELEQRVAQRTQTLAQFGDRLKQLHRLATAEYKNLATRFADYLQTGCQMLNLSTGMISEVKDYIYKIVAVESPLDLVVGYEVHCRDTYCLEVVETQKTITFDRVSAVESMGNHPIYLNFKLESFIGTPIFVNGKLHGTLNFSDTESRTQRFTQEEIEIVELMARDIGQFIASMKAEKAIQKSENLFRNTFEQAATGMAHVSPEGQFIKVNQRLCDIVDYSSDLLLHLTFPEITHPDDLDLDLEYIRQMLAGEIESYSREKRYFRRDSSIVWVNVTVSLVKNDQGNPEYLIFVIEDISERKVMAKALTEANQAKDTFISQMNHELRTPLNSILGFTQILQKDLTLNAQQKQTLDLVASSGEYLLTLINSILEFSKIEAGKSVLRQQDFNLSQLLDQVASTTRHRAETKGLSFHYHLDLSVPLIVKGDATKLQQLLLNLLDNAIKFTDAGAVTLDVNLHNQPVSSKVFPVRFQIIDTGVGIAPQDQDKIFEPFIHLENDGTYREGTGLGLTISQKIAHLMSSKLHFKNNQDEGTTFWFDLDLAAGDISQLREQFTSEPSSPINHDSKKILIVDDIVENRYLLTQYLSALNFVIAEADNGKQCLEIAESFQPDVILLDILMPVMDGIETLKHLRQHPQLKETVVIFVSANSQFKNQLRAAKMQFEGFLIKPVNLKELSLTLQNYISLPASEPTTEVTTLPIIFPAVEQLQEILQLSKIGDMEAILELANHALEELDSQYHPFFHQVSSLAESFRQYQLIKLIEKSLAK